MRKLLITLVGLAWNFLGFASGWSAINIHDNVTSGGAYGIIGDGTGLGIAALNAYASGYGFASNVIEGSTERTIVYPSGNYSIAPGTLASKLGANYSFLDGANCPSTDGSVVGVDPTKLPQ